MRLPPNLYTMVPCGERPNRSYQYSGLGSVMAKVTVVIAALLILLGCVGYFGTPAGPAGPAETSDTATTDTAATDTATTDAGGEVSDGASESKRSVTALIPAFVGGILLIFGLLAFNEGIRKHAMHGAVMVGLLGFLAGAGRGSMGIGKLMSGDPSLNMRSFVYVWLMALLCLIFVIMCVNSFIQARKRREQSEAA